MLYLAISLIIVVYFVLYFLFYKEERANVYKNIVIYALILVVGTFFFFRDGVTSKVLGMYKFDGLVARASAETFVSAEFQGVDVLYSWYGFANLRPSIIVMAQRGAIRRKIIIDAFSGKALSYGFDPIDAIPTVSEKLNDMKAQALAKAEADRRAAAAAAAAAQRERDLRDQLAREWEEEYDDEEGWVALPQTQPAQQTQPSQQQVQPQVTPPAPQVVQPAVQPPQTQTRAS